MDKVSVSEALADAGLPQPESVVLGSGIETLEQCEAMIPAYVKTLLAWGVRAFAMLGLLVNWLLLLTIMLLKVILRIEASC